MALIPRKTYPELSALTAPVVDGDVLAAYRSPGPLRRLTASTFADYIKAFFSASGGSALVSFLQSGTGATAETVQATLRRVAATLDQFSGANDTIKLQKALDAKSLVYIPNDITLNDTITLNTNQYLIIDGTVTQSVQGKNAFVATSKDNVTIQLNGSVIGPGGWNPGGVWTGNQGHEDRRGIRFVGCTNSRLFGQGTVGKWGNACIDVTGGSEITIVGQKCIGVNAYGETIPADGNFNNGVYIVNDLTYGKSNGVRVVDCDFTEMAQGILRELISATNAPDQMSFVTNCSFYDIPGQHGIYNQAGYLTVVGCSGLNVNTSVVKNQSSVSGFAMTNVVCRGNSGQSCGGSLYEVAALSGGLIEDMTVEGQCVATDYALSVNGPVDGLDADVYGRGCVNTVLCSGTGAKNIRIRMTSLETTEIPFVCTSNGAEIELHPYIYDLNMSNGGTGTGDAIRVTTDGTGVTTATTVRVVNPYIVDPNGFMTYGIRVGRTQSTVRVEGQATITGFNNGQSIVTAGSLVGLPQALQIWETWAPTYSADGGSLTTVTTNAARYTYLTATTIAGKVDVTFTNAGTATGQFITTVPVTANGPAGGDGFDQLTTGIALRPAIRPGDNTTIKTTNYDGTTCIGTGRRIVFSFTYEIA